MTMKLNPSDFTRLFQVKAPDMTFFLDCAMEAYQVLDGLIVIKDAEFTFYLTKKTIERTLADGRALYESEEAFGAYEQSFSEFIDGAEDFQRRLLEKNGIERSDVESLVAFTNTYFTNYSKTEFFYTDEVYRVASERNDQATLRRMKRLDALKFKGREAMNRLFFLQGNIIAHVTDRLAERFGLDGKDLRLSKVSEVLGLFDGKPLSPDVLRRNEYCVLMAVNGERVDLSDEDERAIAAAFVAPSETGQVVRGTIACKGKVRGIVKVFRPLYGEMEKLMAEVAKMEQGQIMVAETTSPDIVAACRKAAAIVTNQGGMMSHAAVVSREMNIPCIVGTGNATKMLKDGDEVEVDANKGIVTILSR